MAIEKKVQIEEIEKMSEEKDRGGDGNDANVGDKTGDESSSKMDNDGSGDAEKAADEIASTEAEKSKNGTEQSKTMADEAVEEGIEQKQSEIDQRAAKGDETVREGAEETKGEIEQSIATGDEPKPPSTDNDGDLDDSNTKDDPDKGTGRETTPITRKQSGDRVAINPTTQTIDISIPQMEKDGTHTEDDDDDTQSIAMGTTKSVTFSVHQPQLDDADEIDAEIARVTMNKASDDQMSNFDVEVDHEGRAQTTNTPVTVITEYQGAVRKR